jgi:hypothetical protein
MDDSRRRSLGWGMRDYAADLEPHILEILHASFGPKWGDAQFWRWKHSTRPGFSPSDVVVCAAADKPIACFHLAVRTMRLAPGLDICCSIEGDFAIEPDARGTGIPQKAYKYVSPRLVSRAVLVRAGFSSRDLYEHVYKPKFGHRMPPTITAQYRKILSDRALHCKLQEFGNVVRARSWSQRFLWRPLTVRMEVEGFQPCDLVLSESAASCTPAGVDRPDLKIKVPYVLLTAARMSPLRATLAVLKSVLSGRVRTAGMMGVIFRGLRARA